MKLEREKREPYQKRPQTKQTEMLETAEREARPEGHLEQRR